jgi:hypothetical protein
MGAKVDIPLVYNVTDPKTLKRDLERLASGVDAYTRNAVSVFEPLPSVNQVDLAPKLAFGTITKVSPVVGTPLILQLPQPDPTNGGRKLLIERTGTLGTAYVLAIGCLVNGLSQGLLPSAIGLYEFAFDGQNYFSNPQLAVDWGG